MISATGPYYVHRNPLGNSPLLQSIVSFSSPLTHSLTTLARTGECIFGGSDHALYAVSVGLDNNSGGSGGGSGIRGGIPTKKRTITMYSKRYGHTDWVTSVAHLADGRVLSAAMDAKICLWDANRTTCTGTHTLIHTFQNTKTPKQPLTCITKKTSAPTPHTSFKHLLSQANSFSFSCDTCLLHLQIFWHILSPWLE